MISITVSFHFLISFLLFSLGSLVRFVYRLSQTALVHPSRCSDSLVLGILCRIGGPFASLTPLH